jgi:hypothetical protein
MTDQTFVPTNTLEVYLQQAMAGHISMDDFLKVFVVSELYMPSTAECRADPSKLVPLTFMKGNTSMAALFTNLQRIDPFKDKVRDVVAMKGGEFLARAAPSFGVVVNPGSNVGFDIAPHGIKEIVEKFVKNSGAQQGAPADPPRPAGSAGG